MARTTVSETAPATHGGRSACGARLPLRFYQPPTISDSRPGDVGDRVAGGTVSIAGPTGVRGPQSTERHAPGLCVSGNGLGDVDGIRAPRVPRRGPATCVWQQVAWCAMAAIGPDSAAAPLIPCGQSLVPGLVGVAEPELEPTDCRHRVRPVAVHRTDRCGPPPPRLPGQA